MVAASRVRLVGSCGLDKHADRSEVPRRHLGPVRFSGRQPEKALMSFETRVLALGIYTLIVLLAGFYLGWVGRGYSQGEGR